MLGKLVCVERSEQKRQPCSHTAPRRLNDYDHAANAEKEPSSNSWRELKIFENFFFGGGVCFTDCKDGQSGGSPTVKPSGGRLRCSSRSPPHGRLPRLSRRLCKRATAMPETAAPTGSCQASIVSGVSSRSVKWTSGHVTAETSCHSIREAAEMKEKRRKHTSCRCFLFFALM